MQDHVYMLKIDILIFSVKHPSLRWNVTKLMKTAAHFAHVVWPHVQNDFFVQTSRFWACVAST